MSYLLVKIVVTSSLVVLVSEVSRRSSLAGAVLASVPIVSVLAMIWLYIDTRDVTQVSALSRDIVWLVLPSLLLFVLLPLLLKRGIGFYPSLAVSIGATVFAYLAAITVARALGFRA